MEPQKKEKLFEYLFKKHFHQLYVHAYGWIHDDECAKDIVHDSFCYLWEHFERYENHNNLLALLYSFVSSRSSDYLRRQQAKDNYIEHELFLSKEYNHEDYSDYQDRLQKVQKSINQLPPQTKRVFIECVLNKKSYKEVADILDISHFTVITLVSRAYKIIRNKVSVLFL